MSTSREILRQALLDHAPLATVIGQRARFDMARQGDDYPLVVMRQTGNEPIRGLDESLLGRRETFQVESWGTTREQSDQVHRLVEDALEAAALAPDPASPDGIDPEVWAAAGIWNVEIWS